MAAAAPLAIGTAGASMLSGVFNFKAAQDTASAHRMQAMAYQSQAAFADISAGLSETAAEVQSAGVRIQAAGQAAGLRHEADKADKIAEAARTAADQTDGRFRDELNVTLKNIIAIRVAAGADPFSPTGAALMDKQIENSEGQRLIALDNAMKQIGLSVSDAAYFRRAASMALQFGEIGAAGVMLQGTAARISALGTQAGAGLASAGAMKSASGAEWAGLGGLMAGFGNAGKALAGLPKFGGG